MNVKKKFELTGESKINRDGRELYRIRALVTFETVTGRTVTAGDLGGWVQKEGNLSQYNKAWISDNAEVYDDAYVYGNANIYGRALVYGNTKVYGNAKLCSDDELNGGFYYCHKGFTECPGSKNCTPTYCLRDENDKKKNEEYKEAIALKKLKKENVIIEAYEVADSNYNITDNSKTYKITDNSYIYITTHKYKTYSFSEVYGYPDAEDADRNPNIFTKFVRKRFVGKTTEGVYYVGVNYEHNNRFRYVRRNINVFNLYEIDEKTYNGIIGHFAYYMEKDFRIEEISERVLENFIHYALYNFCHSIDFAIEDYWKAYDNHHYKDKYTDKDDYSDSDWDHYDDAWRGNANYFEKAFPYG